MGSANGMTARNTTASAKARSEMTNGCPSRFAFAPLRHAFHCQERILRIIYLLFRKAGSVRKQIDPLFACSFSFLLFRRFVSPLLDYQIFFSFASSLSPLQKLRSNGRPAQVTHVLDRRSASQANLLSQNYSILYIKINFSD